MSKVSQLMIYELLKSAVIITELLHKIRAARLRTYATKYFPHYSRRVVVSYKRKYVHEVLVNCLFKLAQEKVWLGELTVPQ